MRVVILAGGYATRLWPLTRDRAKPLLPVADRPLIEYILDRLPPELGRPVLTVNERFARQFERWRGESGRDVELVIEPSRREEEKLGTVGALRFLVKRLKLDEDLLVIAGDNLFGFDLREMLKAYRGRPLLALYNMNDLERVRGRYGVAMVEDHRIKRFAEKPQEPESTLVSTACYLYPRDVLPLFARFLQAAPRGQDAPGYFNQWLLEQEKLELDAFVFTEPWYDIGDRRSYIEANLHYADHDPVVSPDAIIENSSLRYAVVLGNARVRDSLIEDCVIDTDAELIGVELYNCLVGRGTRLRGECTGK